MRDKKLPISNGLSAGSDRGIAEGFKRSEGEIDCEPDSTALESRNEPITDVSRFNGSIPKVANAINQELQKLSQGQRSEPMSRRGLPRQLNWSEVQPKPIENLPMLSQRPGLIKLRQSLLEPNRNTQMGHKGNDCQHYQSKEECSQSVLGTISGGNTAQLYLPANASGSAATLPNKRNREEGRGGGGGRERVDRNAPDEGTGWDRPIKKEPLSPTSGAIDADYQKRRKINPEMQITIMDKRSEVGPFSSNKGTSLNKSVRLNNPEVIDVEMENEADLATQIPLGDERNQNQPLTNGILDLQDQIQKQLQNRRQYQIQNQFQRQLQHQPLTSSSILKPKDQIQRQEQPRLQNQIRSGTHQQIQNQVRRQPQSQPLPNIILKSQNQVRSEPQFRRSTNSILKPQDQILNHPQYQSQYQFVNEPQTKSIYQPPVLTQDHSPQEIVNLLEAHTEPKKEYNLQNEEGRDLSLHAVLREQLLCMGKPVNNVKL